MGQSRQSSAIFQLSSFRTCFRSYFHHVFSFILQACVNNSRSSNIELHSFGLSVCREILEKRPGSLFTPDFSSFKLESKGCSQRRISPSIVYSYFSDCVTYKFKQSSTYSEKNKLHFDKWHIVSSIISPKNFEKLLRSAT